MCKKIISAVMTAVLLIAFLSGCVANTPTTERLVKIAYVSDPEGSGTDAENLVEAAMAEIGEYYDFEKVIYEVSSLSGVKDVVQKAIKNGSNLFVGTSYAVNSALLSEFNDAPGTMLAMIGTQAETDKHNVVSISFKMEEAAFLAGYMAAKESASKVVGYIGGFDEDYSEQYAGFYAGAKYADENISVVSAYTQSYNNSVRGKEAAEELKGKNADVIYLNCGSCALGATELFSGSEVKLILSDLYNTDSDNIIAKSTKSVKTAALHVIDEYLNNELYPGEYRHGISYGFVELNIIKADDILKGEIAEIRSRIRTSELKIPSTVADADAFLAEHKNKQ